MNGDQIKRFLVADDEPDIARCVQEWITHKLSSNIEVKVTRSVKETIGLMKTERFDMIVCDNRLADGPGDDVFQFLVRQKDASTKFIMFSQEPRPSENFIVIRKPEFQTLMNEIKFTGVLYDGNHTPMH